MYNWDYMYGNDKEIALIEYKQDLKDLQIGTECYSMLQKVQIDFSITNLILVIMIWRIMPNIRSGLDKQKNIELLEL